MPIIKVLDLNVMISIKDIFSIGPGPSSSHTVGPMRAAKNFAQFLFENNLIEPVSRVRVTLFNSLALTGKGHGTDRAVILGLMGHDVETATIPEGDKAVADISDSGTLLLFGSAVSANTLQKPIKFNLKTDLVFDKKPVRSVHANTLTFEAFNANDTLVCKETYYSVGGGFIEKKGAAINNNQQPYKYVFKTGNDLLSLCKETYLSIADIMKENELCAMSSADLKAQIERIWLHMKTSVINGLETDGTLPGGLNVQRRAKDLAKQLTQKRNGPAGTEALEWLSVYAIAVNEENAAGNTVVTAPTNGASGVIPALLMYYDRFEQKLNPELLETFFLTASAIAYLFKENSSISGAEMGCQGEVGVAASMAAAGYCALKGGSPEQIECAAEIAMEHHLGLTCDPVKGLVQIPCIERNSMGATKAITATFLALKRTLSDRKVSLDRVIRTMKKTGEDMHANYKETSTGGLAVYGIEC